MEGGPRSQGVALGPTLAPLRGVCKSAGLVAVTFWEHPLIGPDTHHPLDYLPAFAASGADYADQRKKALFCRPNQRRTEKI